MKPGLLVVAAVAIGTLGCNVFGPDQSVILGVTDLSAPATIGANNPLDVVLTVQLGGCLSFTRILAQRSATSATLTAWGKDASKGRNDVSCPADVRSEAHGYRFDPPFTGQFDITVNRGRVAPLMAHVQVQ